MMDAYLPKPKEEKWRGIAQRFWEKLNFPNCLRALDGKHLLSGSQFFNYKKTFSIVLLVFVDADYRFQVIQVGDFGRTDDGRVTWDMGWKLEPFMCHRICPLPSADRLGDVASTIVANAAFILKTYPMRPYPGHNLAKEKRIFNYLMSWIRMVVENAFGILASRWRVFYQRINL